MKTVVVTAAARTAIGRFGGAFKDVSALDLTIPLMQALIQRSEQQCRIGASVGGSGARITTTLLYEMVRRDGKTGIASLCAGGGMGCALSIER